MYHIGISWTHIGLSLTGIHNTAISWYWSLGGVQEYTTALSGYWSLEYTTLYYQDTGHWAGDRNIKHCIIRILAIGWGTGIHNCIIRILVIGIQNTVLTGYWSMEYTKLDTRNQDTGHWPGDRCRQHCIIRKLVIGQETRIRNTGYQNTSDMISDITSNMKFWKDVIELGRCLKVILQTHALKKFRSKSTQADFFSNSF